MKNLLFSITMIAAIASFFIPNLVGIVIFFSLGIFADQTCDAIKAHSHHVNPNNISSNVEPHMKNKS